jgi:hypothetical protein
MDTASWPRSARWAGPFWNLCWPPPRRRNRTIGRVPQWTAAVAGLMLALLAGASWMALHRSPAPPMKATQFLVAAPKGYYLEGGGVRQSFALSPDGGRIAFTAKDASGAFLQGCGRWPQPSARASHSCPTQTPDHSRNAVICCGFIHGMLLFAVVLFPECCYLLWFLVWKKATRL